MCRHLIHVEVFKYAARVDLKLQHVVQIVGHIEHLLWQLVQNQVLLGEMLNNDLVSLHTFVSNDLKELAGVHFTQLPRVDELVTLGLVGVVVVRNEEMMFIDVNCWSSRLRFLRRKEIFLQVKLSDLFVFHAED